MERQSIHKTPLSPEYLARCRTLRANATHPERLLWACLRNRQLHMAKFRRQVAMDRFVLDFYCYEARLVIELDGGGHAEPDQIKKDQQRDAYFESLGIMTLRIPNHEIFEHLEDTLQGIGDVLEERMSGKDSVGSSSIVNRLCRAFTLHPLPEGEGKTPKCILDISLHTDMQSEEM